ncbi:MAG: ATP-binding cassette domain-containing protein [Coriobacteriales bacterium]|jgi:peptide/nickel transport system ATP-binding protein|nr:ATP-binding cassette domain-containing protein [Coriobacteriales bacterium]
MTLDTVAANVSDLETSRLKADLNADLKEAVLEARDLSFGYLNSKKIISDLNLIVRTNERVALLAPSGRGKSTLCKLLAGYLLPNKGSVLLDDKPLPQSGVCLVQMVWQHPEQALDPRMRMRQTLSESGVVSPELIESLGIRQKWLSRYPHELSGGELQRFCLARVLAASPRFIIADEISTMLDALTQAQIWQVLIRECEKRRIGMVFVSHSAMLTKRIATRTFKV